MYYFYAQIRMYESVLQLFYDYYQLRVYMCTYEYVRAFCSQARVCVRLYVLSVPKLPTNIYSFIHSFTVCKSLLSTVGHLRDKHSFSYTLSLSFSVSLYLSVVNRMVNGVYCSSPIQLLLGFQFFVLIFLIHAFFFSFLTIKKKIKRRKHYKTNNK